jgi:hypothetical protein
VGHILESSPNGRATCRACGAKIAKGDRRFGERLPNPFDENGGEMTHWFHAVCAVYARPEAILDLLTAGGEIEDCERLAREARLGIDRRRVPRVRTAERAATGRATCRACREPIAKGEWRISLVYYEDGRFAPSGFIHARCAAAYLETTDIAERLAHFSPALAEPDLVDLMTTIRAAAGSGGGAR